MCSLQFDFLDLSDIGEEDYGVLVNILEEKKQEVFLPSSENSPMKDAKDDEEDDGDKDEMITVAEEEDFITQAQKDDSASGISFFVDGGTAEDIDFDKTPPMLSASITPPPSDSPSTLCNDQDDMPPEDEPMNMYPHMPPPPYMNHPPPMMQHMNVHNVPTSASIYNIPTYQAHSGPGVHNAMYQHIPHNHAHQLVPHTVHIENCHVNLSPFGNPQPSHPPGAMYATPPPPPMQAQYQVAPHPQVFQQFITDQQPQMAMQMKPNMDKDYDHKRHDPHNRGNYRGRGRGRGRRRGGREDHERSNSVSSDHSSYSDSGSKNHYKDNNPATPTLPSSHPYSHLMSYPSYLPYTMNAIPRTHQGYPIMPQFMNIHNPYATEQPHHILAYPPQPPPVSVALIPNDNTNHPDYIVSTGYEGSASLETYSYSNVDNTANVEVTSQDMAISSPSEFNQNNANINLVVTCSSNTVVLRDDNNGQSCAENVDPQIEYIESNVSSMKIEVDNVSIDSVLPLNKSPVESSIENVTIEEIESREVVSPEIQIEEVAPTMQPIKNIRNSKSKSPNLEKPLKNQEKSQPKAQNNSQKSHKTTQPTITNASIPPSSSNPVVTMQKSSAVPSNNQKGKENGMSIKPKRKNSPHNKENSKSASPEPTLNNDISDISFGIDSMTVYNQSLAPIIHTKEYTKSTSKQEDNIKLDETLIIKPSQSSKVVLKTDDSILDKETLLPFMNSPKITSDLMPEPPQPPQPTQPKIDEELPKENISLTSVQQSVEPPAWGQKKSWSQLFKPNEEFSPKQIAFVSPFNAKENDDSASVKITLDKNNGDNYSDSEIEKVKVGARIKKFSPDYRPVLLQPRGLINKNYWCYVNAPLQALLACSSFYQLAKTLTQDAGKNSGNLSTPFINSIVDFTSEFIFMNPIAKSRKEKGGTKKEPEVAPGSPFEPTCVYKMLCKTNQFTEGRQQDAEEMLSCVLNGLHDEMVESIKLSGGSEMSQNGIAPAAVPNGTEQTIQEEENEWKVQGPKKKSYVTRTAHFHPSPISQIFWGQLRCVLHHAGGNTTANLQPFNTLPLDIQSPKVNTVKDALSQLVTREEISGFTCPRTNQEVTASNQVMFEDLPRVLILQLKRFIYDNGGLQKVAKRLQFQIDLEITKDLISMNSRGKFSASQRKYKLFGIVNHEGKEANKGHYVADVYHNGYNCWLRYDDSNVKPIPEAVVLGHEPPRVPYLLFYRRMDTLSPPQPQQNGNGSTSSCNGKN